MKYLTLLLALVILSGGVYAQVIADIPTYEQETNVTISIPSIFNGGSCPTTAKCNATIIDPDSIPVINEQTMTKIGAVFEIDLNTSQTTKLGQYEFSPTCCVGNNCDTRFLHFRITPSGAQPLTGGQGTILLTVLAIIFIMAIIFLIISLRSEVPLVKLVFISLSGILFLVVILYSLVIVNETVAASPTLVNGFETFMVAMTVLFSVGLLIMILIIIFSALRKLKIKQGRIDA